MKLASTSQASEPNKTTVDNGEYGNARKKQKLAATIRVPIDKSKKVADLVLEIMKRIKTLVPHQAECPVCAELLVVEKSTSTMSSLFPDDVIEDVLDDGDTVLLKLVEETGPSSPHSSVDLNSVVTYSPSVADEAIPRSPEGARGDSEGLPLTVLARGLAERNTAPLRLRLLASSTLLDLKREIVTAVGLHGFVADTELVADADGQGEPVCQTVRVQVGTDRVVSVQVAPGICFKSFKSLIASASNADAPTDAARVDGAGVHYLVLGGRQFTRERFVAGKPAAVDDICAVYFGQTPATDDQVPPPLQAHGTGFLTVSYLSSWNVRFTLGSNVELNTTVSIANWELPTATGDITTVRQLKASLPSALVANVLGVQCSGRTLLDDETLRSAGIGSMSLVHLLQRPVNENGDIPKRVNVKVEIADTKKVVTVAVPTDCLVAVLKAAVVEAAPVPSGCESGTGCALLQGSDELDDANSLASYNGILTDSPITLIYFPASVTPPLTTTATTTTTTPTTKPSLKPERLTVELFAHGHPLQSLPATDLLPLTTWHIDEGSLVHYIIYKTHSPLAAAQLQHNQLGIDGAISRFSCTPAWSFAPPRGFAVEHSEGAMAAFLASLWCFTAHLNAQPQLQVAVLHQLDAVLVDFPPAVLAMATFVRRDTPSDTERAALAQACFALLREVCPSSVPDTDVLRHTPVLFTFLLTEPLMGSDKACGVTERSLLCDLVDERLVAPVRVRQELYESKCPGRHSVCQGVPEVVIDGAADRTRNVPLSLLSSSNPAVAKELWCTPHPVLSEIDIVRSLAAVVQPQTTTSCLAWLQLHPTPGDMTVGGDDWLVVSRSSLPPSLAAHPDVHPDEDVAYLLRCCPLKDVSHSWSTATTPSSASDVSALHDYPWATLLSRRSPHKCLLIMSPLALTSPPALTLDPRGMLQVFTGKGKGGYLTLFSPPRGSEESVDAKTLTTALTAAGLAGQLATEEADSRTPEEAVFICLDLSNSMSGPASFRTVGTAGCEDCDDDSGNASDDENWQWGAASDVLVSALEDMEDEEMPHTQPQGKEDTFQHNDAAELVRADRAQYERFIGGLRRHPSRALLQELSARRGMDAVFREMCRLEDYEYPLGCATFQMVSKFYPLLRRDDPFAQVTDTATLDAPTAVNNGKPMQIFVKTSSGKTIVIDTFARALVSDVKQAIECKESIEPKMQRLIYAGRVLVDTFTLESLGIYKEATLVMMVNLSRSTGGGAAGNYDCAELDSTVPPAFSCPITMQLMKDPVLASDGHSYDRPAIAKWIRGRASSPMTGAPLTSTTLTPNFNLKSQISDWLSVPTSVAPSHPGDMGSPGASPEEFISLTVRLQWNDTAESTGDDGEVDSIDSRVSIASDDEAQPTAAAVLHQAASASASGDRPTVVTLAMRRSQTVAELRRMILRHTKGAFQAQAVSLGGRLRSALDTLQDCRVEDGMVALLQQDAGQQSLLVAVTTNRYNVRYLVARSTDRVEELAWRVWRHCGINNAAGSVDFWTAFSDSGDGYRKGTIMRCDKKLGAYATTTLADGREALEVEVDPRQPKAKYRSRHMTRLEVVKQLFHAYTNRTEGYALPNRLGLITFGAQTRVACELTQLFGKFKDTVDGCRADGDTPLYDAILLAADQLSAFTASSASYAVCRKRVLVLTDGEDSSSHASLKDCVQKVLEDGLVVDCICIGTDKGRGMKQVAAASGGYHFHPDTLKKGRTSARISIFLSFIVYSHYLCSVSAILALRLNELETVLSLRDREPRKRSKAVTGGAWATLPADDDEDTATRTQEVQLTEPVQSLEGALTAAAGPGAAGTPVASVASETVTAAASAPTPRSRESLRRIMREMRGVHSDNHPAIDVFPSTRDVGFWRAIIEGPDGTPYRGGTFATWVKFPPDYPQSPPEIRFVTPIIHCNINSQGRICHSIFDRNWSPDTTISMVLKLVYGLLLSPDTSDPLDSDRALAFYDDSGSYEAHVLALVASQAACSREELCARYAAEGGSVAEVMEAARQRLQQAAAICPFELMNDVSQYMLTVTAAAAAAATNNVIMSSEAGGKCERHCRVALASLEGGLIASTDADGVRLRAMTAEIHCVMAQLQMRCGDETDTAVAAVTSHKLAMGHIGNACAILEQAEADTPCNPNPNASASLAMLCHILGAEMLLAGPSGSDAHVPSLTELDQASTHLKAASKAHRTTSSKLTEHLSVLYQKQSVLRKQAKRALQSLYRSAFG